MTPRDVIQILKQHGWRLFPGKRFNYNDANVLVRGENGELSEIYIGRIERISGVNIRQIYMENRND